MTKTRITEITMETGMMISSRLIYSGITKAASRLGCSREHLSRVMHGKRKPNAELRRRLMQMGFVIDRLDDVRGKVSNDIIERYQLER